MKCSVEANFIPTSSTGFATSTHCGHLLSHIAIYHFSTITIMLFISFIIRTIARYLEFFGAFMVLNEHFVLYEHYSPINVKFMIFMIFTMCLIVLLLDLTLDPNIRLDTFKIFHIQCSKDNIKIKPCSCKVWNKLNFACSTYTMMWSFTRILILTWVSSIPLCRSILWSSLEMTLC